MQIVKSIFGIIKSLILLFFLVCFVVFMVNNREAFTLNLAPFPFKIETRVFVVLIVTFISGVLFAFAILSNDLISKSWVNMRNHMKIKRLEKLVSEEKKL